MHKLSIGKKLVSGFSGMLACMLVLGIASLWAIASFRDNLDEMSSKLLRKSEISGEIGRACKALRADIRGMMLGAALNHPQEVQKYKGSIDGDFAELARQTQEIRPLLIDPRAIADADGIVSTLAAYRQSVVESEDLLAVGRVDAANKVRLDKQTPLADKIDQEATEIQEIQRQVAAVAVKDANQSVSLDRWIVIGLIASGIAIGLFALIMVRDLVFTLRQTVKDLAAGGEQVASASGQIAATSQTLSQGASEQAASIEEVSASMEEMTAMTKRNADNSTEATAMMAETVKQVERSNSALADMVASMSSIKTSSEKVAKINKTIDEIAFQTNILALNAAVEAARAGEAGMGFAVVADEVRNLAQRSAVAAKDTAALIEESIANANQGTERLELVSAAVRGITDGAGKVKNLLDEVNESSKQQGQGIQQVSTAISQVSTVTQTAAASAEESAAASEELSAQSQSVRDLVQGLSALVEGGAALKHTSPRTAQSFAPRKGVAPKQPHPVSKHDDPFPMETVETGSFREF